MRSLQNISDSVGHYVGDLKTALDRLPGVGIPEFIHDLTQALLAGRGVFIAGNGGSATIASHMAADVTAALDGLGAGIRPTVHCLNDNMARLTAIANDFSYREVFAQQLYSLSGEGDVLILVSVSGQSENILAAAEAGRKLDMRTLALVGQQGALSQLSDRAVVVGDADYGLTEDLCLAINHMTVRVLRGVRAVTVGSNGPHLEEY